LSDVSNQAGSAQPTISIGQLAVHLNSVHNGTVWSNRHWCAGIHKPVGIGTVIGDDPIAEHRRRLVIADNNLAIDIGNPHGPIVGHGEQVVAADHHGMAGVSVRVDVDGRGRGRGAVHDCPRSPGTVPIPGFAPTQREPPDIGIAVYPTDTSRPPPKTNSQKRCRCHSHAPRRKRRWSHR